MALPFAPLGSSNRNRGTAAPRMPFAPPSSQNPASYKGAVAAGVRASFFADQVAVEDAADKTAIQAASLAQRQLESEQRTTERLAKTQADEAKKAAEAQQTREIAKAEYQRSTLPSTMTPEQRRSAEDKLAKKDRELRLRAASTLKEKLAGTGIASQTTGGFFSSEPTEEAKKAQQELERLSNPDLITDEDVAAYRNEKRGDFAEADALRKRLADDAKAAEQRRTATQNLARAKAIKAGVPEEELGAPPKPTAVGPSDPWKRVAAIGELDREGQALQQRSTQIEEQKASVSALDTQLQEAQADYQRGGTAAELLAKRESLLTLQRQREQKAAELQSAVDEHNGNVSAYEAKIQAANESAAPKADTAVESPAPTVPVQAAKSAAKANPDGSFETSQVDNLTSLSQAGERVYWSDAASKATPDTRAAKTKQAKEAITVVQTLSEELTQGVQDAQQRIVDEVRSGRMSPESAQRAQDKAIADYEAAHSEQVATRGQFLYDALRDFSEGQIDAGTLNALYHAAGSPSTGVEAFQEMQTQLAKDKEHVDALEKVILGEDGTGKDDPTLNGTALGLSAQIAEGSAKYQQWLDSGAYPKGMSEGEIAAQESNATAAMEGASKARKELQQIRDAQKQKLSAELTRLGVDVGQHPALIARAELQAMMKARPNLGAIVASKGGLAGYAGEKLPFVGGLIEMARILPYAETAIKLENGDQVAPDELQALTEFVRFSGENPGFMTKVADGIAALPGFVMELAGTAGIVTAVKQGGNKVIGEALQRVATKQGKTQLAAVMARSSADNVVAAWAKQNAKKAFVVKGLRGLAEEAVRLPVASAGRVAANYAQATALDGVSLDIQDDKIATVINTDERSAPLRRLANAVVDSYIENVSERTGFMLGKIPGGKWLSSKVSGLTAAAKQKLISAALFKSVLRANPGAAPGAIAKFLKAANIGNVPEEMFEERLGNAARDLWNGVSGQGWKFTMPSMEDLGAEFLTFLVPGGYAAIQTNRHFAKLDKAISASDAEVTSKLDGFASEPQANAERLSAMVGHPITPQDIAAATDLVGPLHFSDAVRRSDRLQSEFLTKSEEALNAGDFDKASQYRQMALEHSRNKSRAADGELLRGIAASGEIEGIHAQAEALRTQAQSMTDPVQQGAAMQQAADMELIGDRISGIVKVATGRDASLTQNEKDALADPSMKPAVVYENGASIITDEARDMLEQNAPAAWSYVKQSETMRREQLSASATTAPATNQQPANTNENPDPGQKGQGQGQQEVLNPPTTAPATSQPAAGQWSLTGDNGTVVTLPAGEAKTETEAETKLVAMLPKGENVRAGTLTRPKTQNTKPSAKPETKPETKPADYGKGETFDSDKFAEAGKAIPGGKKVKERVAKVMDVLADKLKVRGKSFTGGVSIDTSIRDGGGMKVEGDRLIVNPVLIASQTLDLDETRLADWVGRITSEEFIHLAQLQVLTPAEAAAKLQKLKKSKAGRALLADSLRAYNAAFEADGQTPPKLSDANHYFELVRQIIQDKLDNNKITEAFFAEPGLKADLLEFLQKLSEWLQKRLAGLPKAERASIQEDIDKITAAIARMDQQATPNANTTTATANPATTPENAPKAATETTPQSGDAQVGGNKVSGKAGPLTIVRLKGGRLASVRESELAGNGDTLREFDPATLKPVKGDKGAIARADIDLQASATTQTDRGNAGNPIDALKEALRDRLTVVDENDEIDRAATREAVKKRAESLGMSQSEFDQYHAGKSTKAKQDFYNSLKDGDVIEWIDGNGKPARAEVRVFPDGSKTVRNTTEGSPAEDYVYGPLTNTFLQAAESLKVTSRNGSASSSAETTPVDTAAQEAATSPTNAKPEPTEAQKKAGNYELGHVNISGLDISIENPAGSVRSGTDKDGETWQVTMQSHYGYIKGTEGKDGDHIDIFIEPGTPENYDGPVFVVNQNNAKGEFDEHKAVMGPSIKTAAQARAAYRSNYSPGWKGDGSIAYFPSVEIFRKWATASKRNALARTPIMDDKKGTENTGSFDSDSFESSRAERIKQSKSAGNRHLDSVIPSVETMRGREIFYVHNPSQRGVIRTVDNNRNVYVHWSDSESAEKEMASEIVEDNTSWLKASRKLPILRTVRGGKTYVMQSTLGPSDMQDYVFADKKTDKKPVNPDQSSAPTPENTAVENAPKVDTPTASQMPASQETAKAPKIRPVPGAESSAIEKTDPLYPYKFEGWASTNEGGRLAVEAGGDTAKQAAENAMRLLSERWHEREARHAGKSPKAQEAFKTGDRVTWTSGGKTLTGTIRGVWKEQNGEREATVDVDQIKTAGGVPIGRIEIVGVSKLSRIQDAPVNTPTATNANNAPAVSDAEQKAADAMRSNLEGLFAPARRVTEAQDADYMAAVEAGDMETAQRLVDEAARMAGYDRKLFHGTNATETVEGKSTPGSAEAIANLKALAKRVGLKDWNGITSVYQRLADNGQLGVTQEDAANARKWQAEATGGYEKSREKLSFDVFSPPTGELELGVHLGNESAAKMFGEVFPFFAKLGKPFRLPDLGTWNYQSVMRELRRRGVKISEAEYDSVFNANDNNAALRELLKGKGIESIVYLNEAEGRGDSFIAFDPSQIKSASPVTYDSAGNQIPLSQRFNPESESILYAPARRATWEDKDIPEDRIAGMASEEGAAQNAEPSPGGLSEAEAKSKGFKKLWRAGALQGGDGGLHFGTEKQSNDLATGTKQQNRGIPYFIDVKNAIRLKDLGDWSDQTIENQGYDPNDLPIVVYLNRHEGLDTGWAVDAVGNPLTPNELDALSDDEFLDLNPSAKDSYLVRDSTRIYQINPESTGAENRAQVDSVSAPTRRATWEDKDIPEDRIAGIMATTKLVFEAGIRTPEDFAAFMERTFPGGGSRPYVAGIWQIMGGMKRELRTDTIPDWRAIYEGIDKPVDAPAAEEVAPPSFNQSALNLAETIADRIKAKQSTSLIELNRLAEAAFGGKIGEVFQIKDAYDAVEMAINNLVLQSGIAVNVDAETAAKNIEKIREWLAFIPSQTRRTGEMDALQQFSTPPHLAYAAAWASRPYYSDVSLEPSAGLGGLAAWMAQAKTDVYLNELSDRRRGMLAMLHLGNNPTGYDAGSIYSIMLPAINSGKMKRPTVVVMNPPFSNNSAGRKDLLTGANHIEESLKLLADGGRLVAIVGEGMSFDASTYKPWWDRIRDKYSVRANIHVDGKEYQKYGTTFSNRLLVIDKIAPEADVPVTGEVKTVDELIPLLDETRKLRTPNNESVPTESPTPNKPGSSETAEGGVPGNDAGNNAADSATGKGGARSGGRGGRRGGATSSRPRGGRNGGSNANDRGSDQPAGNSESTNPGSSQQDSGGNEADQGPGLEADTTDAADAEVDESQIFSVYKPRKVRIKGAQTHPSELVESSSMASVEPPEVAKLPNLPAKTILSGALSDAQLESVAYAAQAHDEVFEDGTRQGFFIGDGTGVGKGREIAGVILDNWRKGRKKSVWISEKKELLADAKRDLEGIGAADIPVTDMAKGTAAPVGDGVAFMTYEGLKGNFDGLQVSGEIRKADQKKPARIENLLKWLGADFDGVIALDEVHNAGNVLAIRGPRGTSTPSATALRVVDVQAVFPKARILYVSATGATEPNNIAFATRLGLWGQGKAFQNVVSFFNSIKGAGLSAMEIFARDLKAMGLYMARTLSFKGVGFSRLEHSLTPEQETIYSKAAEGWQTIFSNLDAALASSGGNNSRGARMAASSAFWSSQQRFFNNLLTSLQMPSVLADMREKLDGGNSIVLQLVSTNESALERAIVKAAIENSENPDYDNLDMSNRSEMLEYINNSFPVQKFVEVPDGVKSDGTPKTKWVPLTVKDEDGKDVPVLDPDAVAMRDKLLTDIATLNLPDPPLEQIMNAFGSDAVAEITGRKRRLVVREDDSGRKRRVLETNRNDARLKSEKDDFLAGKRRILIFSNKGGTGFSYHAGKTFKNQQRRYQYVIQAGWTANKAIQGLGRTHRSDQVVPPHYVLASTNVRGHQRFISTIARRLQQLGALTSGDRKSAGQGLFRDGDNLEDDYGQTAVDVFFANLFNRRIEGLNFGEVTGRLGYVRTNADGNQINTLVDESGTLNRDKIPDIRQFLNRILALGIQEQNAVFDAFMDIRQKLIERAQVNGTYDSGVETMVAPEAETVADDVVYEDDKTGAKTRITEIKYKKYYNLTPFDQVKGRQKYLQNRRTKKIHAFEPAFGTITQENGTVEKAYWSSGVKSLEKVGESWLTEKVGKRPGFAKIGDWIPGVNGPQTYQISKIEDGEARVALYERDGKPSVMPSGRVYDDIRADASMLRALYQATGNVIEGVNENANYLPDSYELTEAEANDLWDQEYDAQPKYEEKSATFIVGTILPVWHRIPAFYKKVRRVKLLNGESFLGVEVPEEHVAKTRAQLGASAANLGPQGLIDAVIGRNATVNLSNGWKVKRTLSAGDKRLEVIGPNVAEWITPTWDRWKSYFGGYMERINYVPRLFIPANAKNIDDLLRFAPAMDVIELDNLASAPARPNRPQTTHRLPDGAELTEAGNHTLSAPVRAYHGTPHKVDKFRLDKIGTGEGAQAYGWGLYMAESKAVAEGYRKNISQSAHHPILEDDGNYYLRDARTGQKKAGPFNTRAEAESLAQGNLYTVELLPDEADFLDWDKPLSEQSEKVKAALQPVINDLVSPADQAEFARMGGRLYKASTTPLRWTADILYKHIARQNGQTLGDGVPGWMRGEKINNDKAASEYLTSLGIPGIKYLDGNSRDGGSGTSNYVIFDEKLVRILEENGTPVAVSAPARLGLQDPEFAAALDAINATLPDPSALDDLRRRSGIVTDSPTMEELAQGAQNMRWSGRAVYDEARDRQTHAEWSNQAASNIQADESGRLKNLVTKTATGQVLTAIETKEAQLLMPKLAMRAILSGDANALRDTGTVTWGYEIAGTAQARGLTARWQPHLTPEERHREYIAKAMFTPDRLTRERIASAPTEREKSERVAELEAEIEQVRADALARERDMLSQMSDIANKMAQGREAAIAKAKKELQSLRSSTKTEIDKLRADLAKTKAEKDKAELLAEANKERIEQIREAFADMGVTLEQVLVTKEARLSILGTNVVKGVFASFTEKERKAVRHRLDGFSNRQISKFNGISIAGLEAIFAKFDAALMTKFEAMAAQGITVEDFETVDAAGNRIDIDKLIDKDGNLMAPARPQLTPEEIKERALAMFRTIMPSEDARKSGALKRQKGEDKPTEAPYGFDLSRPEHAAMLVRAIGRLDSSAMDMVYEFWINGLLSGPTTQVANIVGNIGAAALEYGIQRPLAAILNAIWFRDAAGPSLGEYLSMVKYAGSAFGTALRFAKIAWDAEVSLFDSQWLNKPIVLSGTGGKGQVERFAIPGKTGKFIRIPTRSLGVADEFAKHLIGQLEAAAQAHRIAKAEGLTGDAFDKRVDTLVRVPGSAAWIAAVDQAHKMTFTEDLPEGMQKMQNWLHERAKTPWGVVVKTLLRFVFPFVRTPYNIFKTGIRKTPLGSLRMVGKGLAAWKGGRPFFDSYPKAAIATDLAEQMLGWVAALAILAIGEGDPDDDKKTWLLTGTRSMNDNWGEDQLLRRTRGGEMALLYKGEPVFAWGRYEPFATIAATLIDAGREIKSMRGGVPPTEALKKATFDLIDQARSKTFLQGLDGLMGMLDERSGKNPMDSFVKFVTTAAVPNIIRQPLRNMDNYARDTRNAPWYYAAVPFGGLAEPLYDLYGRPVEKGGNSASRLLFESPLKKQPVQVADKAMRAYGDANPMDPKYLSNPTRAAFRFKDVFGKWQSMTPQQAADYRKAAGQQFAIEAAGVLPSPSAPSEEDMRQLGNLKERVFSAKKKEMFPGGFAPSPTPRRVPSLGELFGRVLRPGQ